MDNQFTIFFDLEETLIESWHDHTWLTHKVERIKKFISRIHQENNAIQFGLMSWAVWNDVDKKQFQEKLQLWIEEQMKITFNEELILSIDDWCILVMREAGLRLSRQDIFDIGNKETVLFWLRNAKTFPTGNIFLIDDAVEHNNTITSLTRNISILNVDRL